MRPGHFWACEFGDAGKLLQDPSRVGSAILAGPFESRQYWPPNEGEPGWKPAYRGMARHRYDEGDCALLLNCYFHRTADDAEGLTFLRWKGLQRGEVLVVNSSELRAVQGLQRNGQPHYPLHHQHTAAENLAVLIPLKIGGRHHLVRSLD